MLSVFTRKTLRKGQVGLYCGLIEKQGYLVMQVFLSARLNVLVCGCTNMFTYVLLIFFMNVYFFLSCCHQPCKAIAAALGFEWDTKHNRPRHRPQWRVLRSLLIGFLRKRPGFSGALLVKGSSCKKGLLPTGNLEGIIDS